MRSSEKKLKILDDIIDKRRKAIKRMTDAIVELRKEIADEEHDLYELEIVREIIDVHYNDN